ncbi:hypothetical protein BJX61DRAFT_507126 [Aspergillus egyptiacus]|nr:hypothetical protein BJX61DRAFT_507126 [Aspergillus egyptiacus]
MDCTLPPNDPLTVLPPELVLRVLDFASLSTIASLTAVSRAWHQFIDRAHQDAIYASKVKNVEAARDLSAFADTPTFSKWFEGTASWKSLCERRTVLERSWASSRPLTREMVLQVGNDPVWRFRADLKRRFIVSTSHSGGLNVTDMDTGMILWSLPSTLDTDNEHAVRPYAHLEYQDGMAVFDREGDAVEVWQTDLEGTARGEFRRIAILDHDCQTRGFQLSYWTLCVVSTEGQGFVYDMTQRPPKRTTHLEIERNAVGHLDQSENAVMYSMGPRGYHVYDKTSGSFLGALQPSRCTKKYHITHPAENRPFASTGLVAPRGNPPRPALTQGPPSTWRTVPIKVEEGPLPPPSEADHVRNGDDEWGAGMEDNGLFVGVSRGGRVFVCSDWRKALYDPESFAACSAVIECETDGSNFDLGGWLSVRNGRLMFEVQDRIYVVALDENKQIQAVDNPARASYSLVTCSTPQLAVPVSFMALYDDAIMTTFTTFGRRQHPPTPDGTPAPAERGPARIFPTKSIRILNLAPEESTDNRSTRPPSAEGEPAEDPKSPIAGLWERDSDPVAHYEAVRSQALLQVLSMLREQYADEEQGLSDDDPWEDVHDE